MTTQSEKLNIDTLEQYERGILKAYIKLHDIEADDITAETLDRALGDYIGEFETWEEMAQATAEDIGDLQGLPDYIKQCIDWSKVSELLSYDIDEMDGHFSLICRQHPQPTQARGNAGLFLPVIH